jgi:hypothetical protein
MFRQGQIWVIAVVMTLIVAQPSGWATGSAWQPPAAPPGKTIAPVASGQSAGSTTTYVPRTEVVYETVYDTICEQVPVTQMQTRWRTEYRNETVPLSRTIYEQKPATATQVQHRTEYHPQSVPVIRSVSEQVPVTVMTTQQRQVPRQVAVTRCVMEPVAVPAASAAAASPQR